MNFTPGAHPWARGTLLPGEEVMYEPLSAFWVGLFCGWPVLNTRLWLWWWHLYLRPRWSPEICSHSP